MKPETTPRPNMIIEICKGIRFGGESLTPWATPFDVHSVERVRFPQPVARRSPLPKVVFGLACALGGACFVMFLEGVVAVVAFNFN